MKLTVLIVEDDPTSRNLLERLLRLQGYDVCMPLLPPFAANALKLLETERVDAVILDLKLGEGFDGFDLARRLRDHKEWRKIPVFLSTGLDEEEIRARAVAYAFAGLRLTNVGKPLDSNALFRALAALREERRGTQ